MNFTTAVLLASLAVGAGVCSPSSASAPPAEARASGVAARFASPAAAASTTSEPVAAPAAIELSDKGLPAARGLLPRRAPRNALAATEAPKPALRPAPRKLETPAPLPEPQVQPATPEPADFSDLASGGSAPGNGNAVASPPSPPIVPAREPALARDTSDDLDDWRPSTPLLIASSVGAIGLTLGALGAGFGDGGGDVGFAVAGAGIGAIGLATAGILLLLESGDDDEPKQVRVAVGPAAVAVRGGF